MIIMNLNQNKPREGDMNKVILVSLLLMLSGCCMYVETRHYLDRDIKEIGISSFNARPIAQDDCEGNR